MQYCVIPRDASTSLMRVHVPSRPPASFTRTPLSINFARSNAVSFLCAILGAAELQCSCKGCVVYTAWDSMIVGATNFMQVINEQLAFFNHNLNTLFVSL